jgi:hypothetical protein
MTIASSNPIASGPLASDEDEDEATPAAVLPTLSAPTFVPGSLTSTGFRPQVTATWS